MEIVIDGLTLLNEGNNNIEIDEKSIFKQSKIIINGNNNNIIIGKCNITKLMINLKGNNKIIKIEASKKNINNLKITSIRGNEQTVTIQNDFGCGGCEIQMNDGKENLTIGDDCLFSWGIKIRTSDGHSVVDLNTNKAINLPKDVRIGNHVWVGEDVKFLKGSTIPNNCIVGSGAIVTKSFYEENSVIASFPAKIMKSNVTWDRRMPYQYNIEEI